MHYNEGPDTLEGRCNHWLSSAGLYMMSLSVNRAMIFSPFGGPGLNARLHKYFECKGRLNENKA